ncbi:MAG: hypothetical protein K0U37_00645 [Gammaproteobacteria bacterium]|nr:hypothetical protein [Gammaproteobacteria bacterium]
MGRTTKQTKKTTKSRNALVSKIKDTRLEERKTEFRRQRDEAKAFERRMQAESAQREAAEAAPAAAKQKARKEAAIKTFKDQCSTLVTEGVKGFDRFDTSLNAVMALSKAEAIALNETIQPWTRLKQGIAGTPWLFGQILDGTANLTDMAGDWLQDVTGIGGGREHGEVDLPGGPADTFLQNMEVDVNGEIEWPSVRDMPGYEDVNPDLIPYLDDMHKQIIILLLEKNGYRLNADGGYERQPVNADGIAVGLAETLDARKLQELYRAGPPDMALQDFYKQAMQRADISSEYEPPEEDNSFRFGF